jgi:hypothetical protein
VKPENASDVTICVKRLQLAAATRIVPRWFGCSSNALSAHAGAIRPGLFVESKIVCAIYRVTAPGFIILDNLPQRVVGNAQLSRNFVKRVNNSGAHDSTVGGQASHYAITWRGNAWARIDLATLD